MPAPDLSPMGERLRERTEPLQPPSVDANFQYAHANLCEALMLPLKQVAEIVDPQPIGNLGYYPWEPLFDVDVCPEWALPWLAQVVGVRLPATITGDAARQYIKDMSFEKIGRPSAIITAITPLLTGSKTVTMRERYQGDAYVLEIVTYTAQTPDPDAVLEAIESQVPAAIKVIYNVLDGWEYQTMTEEDGAYSTLPTKFASYGDLTSNTRI